MRYVSLMWCGLLVVGLAWAGVVSAQAPETEPAAGEVAGSVRVASPVEIRLDSPRATMFTFLNAMNAIERGGAHGAQAWDAVAATFGAAEADEATRAAAPALFEALKRLGNVEETDLPGAEVREEGLHRYTFFPGRPEQAWVWEELKAFGGWPRGSIVLEAADAGAPGAAWRFTRETIADAPALAESLQPLPPRHFAAIDDTDDDVAGLLGPTFVFTRWWEWAALLGCIFAGLAAGKILSTVLRGIGKRLRERHWPLRAVMFESFASPGSLALLTVGLAVGLHVFIYLQDAVAQFTFRVLEFLFLIATGWALYNLVDVVELAILRVSGRTANRLDDMVVPLIRKSLRIFIIVVFFLVVAQNVFGVDITGWLAGLGIAGLAVSLAAQDSVKNLFGSLTVFFDKPFVVGDFISYGGYTGTVEEIGFRSTRLRLLSGHLVTIPNMKWNDSDVENIQARPHIRREMNITIPYNTPPERVEQAVGIVREVLTSPEVVESGRFNMESLPPRVAFNEFNADSLNIKAYYWYQLGGDPQRGFFTYMDHAEAVNKRLFARFAEAGIEFAIPARTLYLSSDPRRELRVLAEGADRDDDAAAQPV